MSDNVRFHSKHHGKAHHTIASPGYHDSAVDPIASSGSPFMGNFNLSGSHVYYDTSVAADTSKTIGYTDFVEKYDPMYTTVKTQSSSWTVLSGDYWTVTSGTQHPNTLTNNVGIGTNIAHEKLTVSGNISASGTLSAHGFTGISYFAGKVQIGARQGQDCALLIRGNSNTGGDDNPSLHIVDADGTGGSITPNIGFRSDSQQLYQIRANDSLGLQFRNSSDAVKVTFDQTGKVGIGTASPGKALHVVGAIRVNNEHTSGQGLRTEVVGSSAIFGSDSSAIDVRIATDVGNNYANAEGIIIKDGGKVGIGTVAPEHELTVVGDISATGTIHGILPTGGIIPYAGSTAPTGWLLCDGSTISSTTYNALYLVVGTTYGGDSSNFALPDLRGRAPFGVDAMNNSVGSGGGAAYRLTGASTLGGVSGTETQTLSTHQMPSHTHDVYTGDADNNQNGTTGNPPKGSNQSSPLIAAYSNGALTKGGDQPHQNMPPYLVLNYIIKT